MKTYGQFCPVAVASEVLGQRWTLLILRELLAGSTHFNQLRRGVPLMSPSLLAQRLRSLDSAGIVSRTPGTTGRQSEYHLTRAGEELRPLIEQLGIWGRRWLQQELRKDHLDPGLLMWDIQRRVNVQALPARRVVVRFNYTDVEPGMSLWWLVLESDQSDICLEDPGFAVDLEVTTSVRLMTRIWMGDADFRRMLGPDLVIRGPRALARAFPEWLELGQFAGVQPVLPGTSGRSAYPD